MTAELLNTKQTADLLGMSMSCLEHWRTVQKGPPFVRVGPKIVRYRRTDLDLWIESCVNANERPRG